MQQVDRVIGLFGVVAPRGGHIGQGLDVVATQRAQVARDQPREHQIPPWQQGGGDVGKQQVAEVVAVKGAEQDGRTRAGGVGGHGAFLERRARVSNRVAPFDAGGSGAAQLRRMGHDGA